VNRTTPRFRLAVVALVALALLLAPAAVAGKGGPSAAGGTIKLVPLSSTDGAPHYGQKVTFEVFTSSTAYPWVVVRCYQNGSFVYEQANGIFPTSLNQVFSLGPTPAWTGGAADCMAYLQNWSRRKKTTLATLSFHVYG
jgi:hypothetical protein